MRVSKITIQNFRNLAYAEIIPDENLTVLCGQNGQGKTNLLEAVWMLTGGKSFRGNKDGELIRLGQPFAVIEAETLSCEETEPKKNEIRITVGQKDSPRPGRRARCNGVDHGRAAAIAGTLTAVVFEPNHLALIKGSPEGRRKFLDSTLCQLYPAYLTASRRYLRLITQKNALLKNWESTPGAAALLSVLNDDLARQGEIIQARRLAYLQQFIPLVAEHYSQISSGRESINLVYRSTFAPGTLRQTLEQLTDRERAAGFCLAGPHKEDLHLLLEDKDAKTFASQGQQRSMVLSMKLAEAACIRTITGEHPVMLLDDVLSELDEMRRDYLLTRMEHRQTFVTTCDDSRLLHTAGRLFRIKNGNAEEEKNVPASGSGLPDKNQ